MTHRAAQRDRFLRTIGWQKYPQTLVAGDASNRRYDRLTTDDGSTAILMDAPPEKGEDVRPFIRIAEYLLQIGLSAPKIFHSDCENGFLLIEDLGDARFAEMMRDDPTQQRPLYHAAMSVLIHIHHAPPISLTMCDANWLTQMTAPVFEWYAAAAPSATQAFDAAFRPLAQAFDQTPKVVALRDYHAENLLHLPQRTGVAQVGILDFQDAILAHPAYDLVSVLQDARRDVPLEIEAEIIDAYLSETGSSKADFKAAYALLGLQRNLRILGIFARLCIKDGKAHYVDMIPRVWGYVRRNLAHPALAPLADILLPTLPDPTPDFLEQLKNRCATPPML